MFSFIFETKIVFKKEKTHGENIITQSKHIELQETHA